MFVEKLLLKHCSCVHPFISCQIAFSGTFHSYMAHKASNAHYLAIYKISLLTIIKDEMPQERQECVENMARI